MTANDQKSKVNGLSFPLIPIKGKLIKVLTHESSNGNVYEHVINLPNDDPYGHPAGLTIKSKARIGNADEEVNVVAQCSRRGYRSNGQQRYNHEFWLYEGN